MACCICLAVLHACAPREKNSSSIPTDSTSLTDKVATGLKEEPTLGNTPLDTIVVSYPNGKKLHLLVLEYYDSLPDKPIKDFEVMDVDTKELVFRSVSKRLVLGYETDPMKGEFDSMFVVPTYSISSKDPLTVDLNFIVNGQFRAGSLSDLTYNFYEGRPLDTLSFLRYAFQSTNNKPVAQSSLLFTPHECGLTQTELKEQFNKIKLENHFYTDQGTDFMKQAFNCFLNKSNPNYNVMLCEFRRAMAPTPNDPYTYYPFITYLDEFIINLTFQ